MADDIFYECSFPAMMKVATQEGKEVILYPKVARIISIYITFFRESLEVPMIFGILCL